MNIFVSSGVATDFRACVCVWGGVGALTSKPTYLPPIFCFSSILGHLILQTHRLQNFWHFFETETLHLCGGWVSSLYWCIAWLGSFSLLWRRPFILRGALFKEGVLMPHSRPSPRFTPSSRFDREAGTVRECGKGRNYRFWKCFRDSIMQLYIRKYLCKHHADVSAVWTSLLSDLRRLRKFSFC